MSAQVPLGSSAGAMAATSASTCGMGFAGTSCCMMFLRTIWACSVPSTSRHHHCCSGPATAAAEVCCGNSIKHTSSAIIGRASTIITPHGDAPHSHIETWKIYEYMAAGRNRDSSLATMVA
jgi:hypothetical protein